VVKSERRNQRRDTAFKATVITWLVLVVVCFVGAMVTAFSPGGTSMLFVYPLGGLIGIAAAAVILTAVFAIDSGGVG
jgi:hypothetical protein